MRVKPPRVPPAAQLAFAATQGPRVLPGTYTVRLTKGGKAYETQARRRPRPPRAVHRRATARQQFDAAMRVHALFGEMSALVDRIEAAARAASRRRATKAAVDAATKTKLAAFEAKLDDVRKQIVATKEGGAITGEERLREHTDLLYGAIMGYEGAPGAYQVERIDVLEAELADIEQQFEGLVAADLPAVNQALQATRVSRQSRCRRRCRRWRTQGSARRMPTGCRRASARTGSRCSTACRRTPSGSGSAGRRPVTGTPTGRPVHWPPSAGPAGPSAPGPRAPLQSHRRRVRRAGWPASASAPTGPTRRRSRRQLARRCP